MSITKNTFTLKKAYELINDGKWVTYSSAGDPASVGTLWKWGSVGFAPFAYLTGVNNQSSPTQVTGTDFSASEFATFDRSYGSFFLYQHQCPENGLWGVGFGTGCASCWLPCFSKVNISRPVQVFPGSDTCTSWKDWQIGYVDDTFSVIDCLGNMYMWGSNQWGQLGLNDRLEVPTKVSSPTQIPGTGWCEVTFDLFGDTTLAIKNDGTLWAWGKGENRLGLNTTVGLNFSTPMQVPGTQWTTICTNNSVSAALKSDGTLWTFGVGSSGGLGLGNNIPRSSPTQVPGTNWIDVQISMFSNRTVFARKSDNSLWVWGANSGGELGLNDVINKSSPTQLPGSWCIAKGARDFSGGVKTDGTLWMWGTQTSDYPVLGLNNLLNRSSPTQIPGTGWIDFHPTALYMAYARKTP